MVQIQKMISKKDISIIIQGPVSEISLNNLDYYCQFSEVIISTWNDKPLSFDLSKYKNIKILVSSLPSIKEEYNYGNFYFQCLSVLNGLSLSSKKYSIKTRSDESFSNLDSLINKLQDDKIVTTNIMSQRDVDNKYHPSDHLFFSKTKTLTDIYKKCACICEAPHNFGFKKEDSELIHLDSNKELFKPRPESIFGKTSCEIILKKEATLQESKENMKKCFDIVPISQLGDFKFSANSSRHNKDQPYYRGVDQDWFTENPMHPNSIDEI